MYKNYIFDLYGTLIDIHTNEWNSYLWKKMAEFYGFYGAFYTPSELKQAYFEQTAKKEQKLQEKTGIDFPEIKIEKVMKKLFQMKDVEVDKKTCQIACQFFRIISTKYIKLYDGVPEFLSDLKAKGKKIYLLSNAQQIFTEYEMKLLNIHHMFDGLVFSSNEKCRKPSETFFQIVLDRYKLNKRESIMIGNDAGTDILGANQIGMDSLYIHTNISPQNVQEKDIKATYKIMDGDFRKVSGLVLKK